MKPVASAKSGENSAAWAVSVRARAASANLGTGNDSAVLAACAQPGMHLSDASAKSGNDSATLAASAEPWMHLSVASAKPGQLERTESSQQAAELQVELHVTNSSQQAVELQAELHVTKLTKKMGRFQLLLPGIPQ